MTIYHLYIQQVINNESITIYYLPSILRLHSAPHVL